MKHMSREGFVKVMQAAEMLADVVETGSRQKRMKSIDITLSFIEANKSKFERYAKSHSCIYTASVNLGIRKYPYYVTTINIANVCETDDNGFPLWRESDKTFIGRHGERIRKDKIVGWLS